MVTVWPATEIGAFEILQIVNGRFKQNCYLVKPVEDSACVIVDPGSDGPSIIETVASLGLRPETIVLTHGHFDHLGAVDDLTTHYGITCQVDKREERLIRQAAFYAFRFEPGAKLKVPRKISYFSGDTQLKLTIGSMDVIWTPGHTAGSVSLSWGAEFVFTGDTLFRERVGPTGYPESDAEALTHSVARLLNNLPESCVIFPGHGRPWSIGAARSWWAQAAEKPPSLQIF